MTELEDAIVEFVKNSGITMNELAEALYSAISDGMTKKQIKHYFDKIK